MKRTLTSVIAAAVAAMALVSCNREAAPVIAEEQITQEFTVTEESEQTGDELFTSAMAGITGTADEEMLAKVREAFSEACTRLEPEADPETKGIAPLLYKTVKIEYQTVDQDNQPVTASALIVYPLLRKMKQVLLINHGTHMGAMMVPTNYTSVEAIMAATGALCIMPDYIGLGSSSSHPDLYLNHEVHGRTSIDALLALLDYAKAKSLNLDKNYKTYIAGYYQGGSVSLASLRRVQQLDAETQKRINLQRVFCGDGPYDLRRTFETYMSDYEEGKEMGLGAVIPMVINSMFNSYPSEMEGINYEDFFTTWALEQGVPQACRNNDENLIDVMLRFNGATLGEILNLDYIEANPEHLNRLLSLMDRQNLCTGWEPQYRLKLLHCNPDGVVPFANFEEAYENLNNGYMEDPEVVEIKTSILDAIGQHIYGMLVMTAEILTQGLD